MIVGILMITLRDNAECFCVGVVFVTLADDVLVSCQVGSICCSGFCIVWFKIFVKSCNTCICTSLILVNGTIDD